MECLPFKSPSMRVVTVVHRVCLDECSNINLWFIEQLELPVLLYKTNAHLLANQIPASARCGVLYARCESGCKSERSGKCVCFYVYACIIDETEKRLKEK